MPATTPLGWPYVLPTDHPLEYPAASQQLATKGNSLQAGLPKLLVKTATTNPSGTVPITAAEFGLTTLLGAVASVQWLGTSTTPQFCSARVVSNSVEAKVWFMSSNSAGTVSIAASVSVTLYVIAWGT